MGGELEGLGGGEYHNPCRVQLSLGPILGFVSQNWVCKSWPPG
jgi:hypothetical protein